MVNGRLPSRLKKEPLIDAIFEVRFTSSMDVASILPGLLMARLGKIEKVERLPISDIPRPIRQSDQNLQFQPLLRLVWEQFLINIGDRLVGISCKLPYVGWSDFKRAILEVYKHIFTIGVIEKTERYSMKYVDLIEGNDPGEMVDRVAVDLNVGGHQLKREPFMVRVEVPDGSISHIVQVIAPAVVKLSTGQKTGVIVDIDSVCAHSTEDVEAFMSSLDSRLVEIHAANKRMFFSSLKENTIEYLEPEYE